MNVFALLLTAVSLFALEDRTCKLTVLPYESSDWRNGQELDEAHIELIGEKGYDDVQKGLSSQHGELSLRPVVKCYQSLVGYACKMKMHLERDGERLLTASSDGTLRGGVNVQQAISRLPNCQRQ